MEACSISIIKGMRDMILLHNLQYFGYNININRDREEFDERKTAAFTAGRKADAPKRWIVS